MEERELTNLEKLEEMDNQLDQAIANCNKVIEQQTRLVDLIEKSEDKDYFASFVKELKDGVENYNKQKEGLQYKKYLIKEINEICKSDESNSSPVLDKVVELFAIFR